MEVQRIPKRTVSVIEPQKSILVDKEKYHQKRVAAYCRVSTDSEEQLTSYQNQMRVYTEMIAANKKWEFAGLYADEGISGTRADKRPEFQRMIRDCQNGKIDYIITKSVSRFARNTVECLEYVRSLKAQGIGIFFEEQNIDTLNKRMLDLVNETVAAGKDVESSEDEFKGISDQIEQLNRRIAAIQESIHKDGSRQARLEELQNIIAERNANETQYKKHLKERWISTIQQIMLHEIALRK